jgi:hypothetical protein
MYCWKDTKSVSNFSYTLADTRHITSVSYCLGEVADAVHVFPTVHTERQLGCRTSNLSYTLIDAQNALLERHDAVHVFP